ncbi:MAG TPA: hypothetical protein V6C69_17055, partial [Trichormus sp.]
MSEQPAFPLDINHLDGALPQAHADAALTSTNLFHNEIYRGPGNTMSGGFDPYKFAGISQVLSGRDLYGYSGRDHQPVAADNINPQLEQAKKILTDANSSSIDKLHMVQALANAGVNQLELPDSDGRSRTYTIRTGQIGGKTMVHLFANDDQGKERIVLRGVINGSGSFDQEHDNSGSPVGFVGTWWQGHMSGRSPVGTSSAQEQATDQSQAVNPNSNPYSFNGGSNVVCHIRGDASAGTSTTNDTTDNTGTYNQHVHHRRGEARNQHHNRYHTPSDASLAVPYANVDSTATTPDYAQPLQNGGGLQHLKEVMERARNGGPRLNVVQIGDSHIADGTETE